MRLDDSRESDNVEDRRGDGSGGGGLPMGGRGVGIGAILIAIAASYFLGVDPQMVLGLIGGGGGQQVSAPAAHHPPANDAETRFVRKVLAETEDTWQQIFRASGKQYREPKLVLFSGRTDTACGQGQAATGPFYCPADQKVYIDLSFYRDLRNRFRAPGEFAQAYVIAHEIGHHVQNLLGTSQQVHQARQQAHSAAQANALSVRLELQADCYAGVWAKRTDAAKGILEPGELEQAITAASAIGDDRLQKQTRGVAVPETFTHGSSEQRVRWFRRGFEQADPRQCDTFRTAQL